MPDVIIRKAVLNDAADIVRFNQEMAQETENKVISTRILTPGVKQVLATDEHGFYLVAEHQGTIVASLMITYEWSDWRNGVFWWIQSVYVVPEYRGQSVYRNLYHYVKQLAAGNTNVCGFRLYVEKSNTRAQHVYRSLGMNMTDYDMYEEQINR